MGRGYRIRHHVNPLSAKYLEPRAQPVARPPGLARDSKVEVELGCAEGRFSFELARKHPTRFVVGLDIRERLIARNRRLARSEGLANLEFAYVNLNVDLDRVFGPNSVDRFHLLFPDPWFKYRHRKRRVIDPDLCGIIQHQLRIGGELHAASDRFANALEIMAELESMPGFDNLVEPWSFCRDNPVGIESPRERATRARDERVWRVRFVRRPAR